MVEENHTLKMIPAIVVPVFIAFGTVNPPLVIRYSFLVKKV